MLSMISRLYKILFGNLITTTDNDESTTTDNDESTNP